MIDQVRDILTNSLETLTDFRDRVVKMSMAYGHLVVATTAQCLIYKTTNWHTPVVFELKPGTLRYIKQVYTRDLHAPCLRSSWRHAVFKYGSGWY